MTSRRAYGRWLQTLSPLQFALFLYALALVPRLIFVLAAGRADLSLDEIEYHLLARNLAAGNGYRWYFGLLSSFRPPGYPFFLAGVYYLFGPSYFVARIIQTFIAASAPVLTYRVGQRVFGERAGRLGGLFVALYIPLILYSVGLLTENIFIPLLLLAILFLLKADERRSCLNSACAGLCLAAGILIRPEITYALPLIFLWMLWPPRTWKGPAINIATIVVIVAAAVTPWTVRNTRLTGQFVYLDTRTGYNLYIGYRDGADGTFNMDAAQDLVNEFIKDNLARLSQSSKVRLTDADVRRLLYQELLSYKTPINNSDELRRRYNLDAAESDVVMHNWGKERALAFMREHPWKSIGLIAPKFAHFWGLEHRLFLFAYSYNFIGHLPPLVLTLCLLLLLSPFVLLTLFSVIGALFAERYDRKLVLLLLPILFYTALHSLTFGEARFHFVIIPCLALLAANGMILLPTIRPRWRSANPFAKRTLRRRAIAALVLVGLFAAIWTYGLWISRDNLRAVFSPNGNQSHLTF